MASPQSIAHYAALYRTTLLNDVVPFWMRHGFDAKHGGISNLLDDAGNVRAYEKYLWSQGRALWTFSALYNRIEKRAEWLAFADHLFAYLSTHGRDEHGYWMYRLDENGEVLDRDISIYVDGFVMNGMGEYFAATGNTLAKQLAFETYDTITARLSSPGSYGTAPYEVPAGLKVHGVAMMYSFFFWNLGRITGREDICAAGREYARQILEEFYVPEKNAILEYVTLDGEYSDTPAGRACVPGHAIEALWFLITIFEDTGDKEAIKQCCTLIKHHLELAWDDEYGGLQLAMDIDGKTPVYWQKHECKPWWVQVEALVATAYAHLHTGEPWCMEWHARVQEWAYAHYPVATGEWTQWVDRTGHKMGSAALPVKDPFHLPRALIYLIDLFERKIPQQSTQ